MAETRAKARALRDAINVGVVSVEELLGEAPNGAIVEEPHGQREPPRGGRGPFPCTDDRQPNAGDGLMTEAQRRYLFRLLAEQGIRNEAAHDYLRQALGVTELQEATKARASISGRPPTP